MKEKRKIKFEALGPTGEPIGEPIEMNYYNLGYNTPPEEYPAGQEPMKKVRYLLTIGEHQYWVNREGKIFDHLTKDFTIIHWLTGEGENKATGVMLRMDNGDTQCLSIAEYETFLKNREKNG
jgi:hypothetical protein